MNIENQQFQRVTEITCFLASKAILPTMVVPPVAHLTCVPSQETLQSSSPQMPLYLISSYEGMPLLLTVSFVMLSVGQDLNDVLVIL